MALVIVMMRPVEVVVGVILDDLRRGAIFSSPNTVLPLAVTAALTHVLGQAGIAAAAPLVGIALEGRGGLGGGRRDRG